MHSFTLSAPLPFYPFLSLLSLSNYLSLILYI